MTNNSAAPMANESQPGSGKWFDFPIYTFLLPVFYILHGYWLYFDFVSSSTLWKMIGEYCLAAMLIAGVFYFLLRDLPKALHVAAILLFLNFYLPSVNDEFRIVFGDSWLLQQRVWLGLSFILLISYLTWLRKRKPYKSTRYRRFLNLLFALLLLLDFGLFFFRTEAENPNKADLIARTSNSSRIQADLPDVYFILLDEYAGHSSLYRSMNFDNSSFLGELNKRGFFVADSSSANYNSTLYSMGSIWNLNYLPVSDVDTTFKSDAGFAFRQIADAFLPEYLVAQGYRFYNNSWFYMGNTVRVPNPSYGTSERSFISSQTLLNRFKSNGLLSLATKLKWKWLVKWAKSENRYYNQAVKSNLFDLAAKQEDRPRFVYTHFAMPHFPYFFNKKGQAYSPDSLLQIKDSSRAHYVEYLQYCNSEVLEVVDFLLRKNNSKRYQVFIVSDHGFRKLYGEHWASAAFDNLFAYYDSNQNDSTVFKQNLSNVNIFRYWLNQTFKTSLPYLKDSTVRVVFD